MRLQRMLSRLCGMVILSTLLLTGGGAWSPPPQQSISRLELSNHALPNPVAQLTVCPEGPPICQFNRIQEAIDIASMYGLILIQPGIYEERLRIAKSLTLQGTGPGVILQHPSQELPGAVVTIESEGGLRVALQQITIHLGDPRPDLAPLLDYMRTGVFIDNQAGLITLHDLTITGSVGVLGSEIGIGIWVSEGNTLQVLNSQINNVGYGVFARKPAALALVRTRIENSLRGISVDEGLVFISETKILRARLYGLEARGGYLFINHSHFSGDFMQGNYGIYAYGVKMLMADRIHIEGFGFSGLESKDSDLLFLHQATIVRNGSGVVLKGLTRSVIQESRIADNQEWGITHEIKGCYGEAPMIWVGVEVSGTGNEIPDQDEPGGNRKGALCPPGYPWPPGFRK